MSDPLRTAPDRAAAQVVPPAAPNGKGLGTLAVAVVVVAGLYFGRAVLIPITLAVLLSFLLAPLVNLLRRIKLGRVVSVVLSVLISLAIMLSLGGLIGTQVADLATGLPQYQATIENKVDSFQQFTFGRVANLVSDAGRMLSRGSAPPERPGAPQASPNAQHAPANQPPAAIPVEVREPQPTPAQMITRFLSPVIGPLETTGIVIVVAIFILLQRDDLRDRLIRLLGSSDLHRTTTAMDEAARRLSRYFLVQLGINASVGVIIGAGLFLIGAPSPGLWGVLAALLRFVPYVGTWIAAALAVALAAAVDPGWSMAVWTLVLFVVTDLVTSQVIEPMLYGHSTGLSPFSVVVAAIFWSWLWGPIGLILSTPLTLCVLVLGRHVQRLEFLDVLLGDRPALTPVENFYQRALAGDPDEALAQAETLLHDRSLSSYYDEVAIKGLQLAATDVLRGVVTAAQLERIKTATTDLLEGLEVVDDKDPAVAGDDAEDIGQALSPAQADADLPHFPVPDMVGPHLPPADAEGHEAGRRVLCITGRGPLDEPAGALFEQLLRKHGFSPRVIPHTAASRTRFGELDTEGTDTVCIFSLDIRGTPSNIRYLIQRLRQRLPDAAIVVGLHSADAGSQDADEARRAMSADFIVGSLRDMINACLKAAHHAGGKARAVPDKAA